MSRHLCASVFAPVAAFSLLAATALPACTQEAPPRTLTTMGQGTVSIPTTLAQINLGVEVRGATAQQAQSEAAERSSAVVDLLRSRNVDELQTRGIQLNPVYTNRNGTNAITGYSASNIVSFQIEVDRAGELLDDVVEAGATRINGISFTATDEAIAAAEREALQLAARDARDRADVVLGALGLTADEIIRINLNPGTPIVQPYYDRNFAVAEQASTPVVGGDQDIRASVTLDISY